MTPALHRPIQSALGLVRFHKAQVGLGLGRELQILIAHRLEHAAHLRVKPHDVHRRRALEVGPDDLTRCTPPVQRHLRGPRVQPT